jgi:predicted NUDIX family NTP pyrophosphohydrolase
MMKRSAGLLLYRCMGGDLEVLLVHPGGPFWAKKDYGVWSIPKGEFEENENPLTAGIREFEEEIGFRPNGTFIHLGSFKQPNRKMIFAWAIEGDFDSRELKSNLFSMEWPPKSGRMQEFPEVDRAMWLRPIDAIHKIAKGQRPILEELFHRLGIDQKTTTS